MIIRQMTKEDATEVAQIEKGKKEVDYNKSAHNYSYCCFFV